MEREKSAKLFQFLMAFFTAMTFLLVVGCFIVLKTIDWGFASEGGMVAAIVAAAMLVGFELILVKIELLNSVLGFFASTLCLYFARKRKVKVLSIICMIFHTLIIAIIIAVVTVSDLWWEVLFI